MARGDPMSVEILVDILTQFGEASGLRANRLNCSLFLDGVQDTVRLAIENILGYFSTLVFHLWHPD